MFYDDYRGPDMLLVHPLPSARLPFLLKICIYSSGTFYDVLKEYLSGQSVLLEPLNFGVHVNVYMCISELLFIYFPSNPFL